VLVLRCTSPFADATEKPMEIPVRRKVVGLWNIQMALANKLLQRLTMFFSLTVIVGLVSSHQQVSNECAESLGASSTCTKQYEPG